MRKSLFILLLICTLTVGSPVTQVAHAAAPYRAMSTLHRAPLPPTTPITPANSSGSTDLVRLNRPFTIALQRIVTVANSANKLRLQLTDLLSDSRCPAQVNCVVAGQALFALEVQSTDGHAPLTAEIGSYPVRDQNKVRYGDYLIELLAVEPPAPPPGQRLKINDYQVTLVVRRDGIATPTPTLAPTATVRALTPEAPTPPEQPTLDHPFTLRVGETATLAAVDFQITLRSLSDDAGCLTPTDCSVMMADGTLVLQQGNDREILTFITSFAEGQSFDYAYQGYNVRLTRLAADETGEQVATFVIEQRQPRVIIPEPERVINCPHFSIYDAAAILQEEVEPRAVANLVFGPIAPDAEAIKGVCGYLAAAYNRERRDAEVVPSIASAVSAVRGVIGTVIDGGDSDLLLQFAHLLSASADSRSDARYQLQAELMAGDYASVIATFGDLAAATTTIAVTPVDGVGDEGLWFWQPLTDGFFGLLIAREGDRFQVVGALLNDEADETFVLDHAIVVARHLK